MQIENELNKQSRIRRLMQNIIYAAASKRILAAPQMQISSGGVRYWSGIIAIRTFQKYPQHTRRLIDSGQYIK
jgi:hypothetical protein